MTTSPTFTVMTIATSAAAIGTAAVGGMFYVFSTFVMRGLDRTQPTEAITAMRGLNAEAQANAPFLVMFVGSAMLALGVGIAAALRISQPGNGFVVAAAAFGVLGFIVTVAFNIPLNNHLDTLNPSGLSAADAAREWAAYLGPWTAWNHVRTASGLVAAVLFVIGLRYR